MPAGASTDALYADILRTREQLGHTVEELTSRLNVPARARLQARVVRSEIVRGLRRGPSTRAGKVDLIALVAFGLAAGVGVTVLLLRRRMAD
jgi:hypothetical protein